MPGFAVIDFETTGLFASGNHRVIEVAVVHVSVDGQIEGQWDTLINPGRDLGRQDIHRVRAADVMQAPTFAEVAPQLVALPESCLLDRQLSAHEAQALVQLAEELGLSRHRCELLHGEYFAALARSAWAGFQFEHEVRAVRPGIAPLLKSA